MSRQPAAGPVTLGIDVSHYQGRCDFQFLKSKNVEFVFAKATEFDIDPTYASNRASAKKNGILFGAYHYFHPARDPVAQANLFLKLAKPAKGDLRPMIDAEVMDNVSPNQFALSLKMCADTIETAVGKAPIIYLNANFGARVNLPHLFQHYPLYVAHFDTSAPLVPPPWLFWTFHQYTDHGTLPGVGGRVDCDRFNGPLDHLKALCL